VHQHNKESLVELLKIRLNVHATACYSITNVNKQNIKTKTNGDGYLEQKSEYSAYSGVWLPISTD